MNKTDTHPCFHTKAKHKYARVHIPIAPKCNISCNYCNRKYDCVNESRPGVTSSVLTPEQSLLYIDKLSEKINNISTIGIAGPGDAFAQPEITMEAIRLIKSKYPDKLFCVSTNGLNILPYIEELKSLDVTHITLTINSLRPETLQHIYQWVRFQKRIYRGLEAAEILHEQQKTALRALAEAGFTIKINTVLLPEINEEEIVEIAKFAAETGAELMNCIPLIPAKESVFANLKQPAQELVKKVRDQIAVYLQPMTHCARCRADAAGQLGKDESVYKLIQECALLPAPSDPKKPYVAVATFEGLLVNKHLGEADRFHIFGYENGKYSMLEIRKAPEKGMGDIRWIKLAKAISDCGYLLVSNAGKRPVEVLQNTGIKVVEMTGLITDGLDAVYKGATLRTIPKTDASCKEKGCTGSGSGCG